MTCSDQRRLNVFYLIRSLVNMWRNQIISSSVIIRRCFHNLIQIEFTNFVLITLFLGPIRCCLLLNCGLVIFDPLLLSFVFVLTVSKRWLSLQLVCFIAVSWLLGIEVIVVSGGWLLFKELLHALCYLFVQGTRSLELIGLGG